MNKRPYEKGALLRITSGKFRGWRGTRWTVERENGTRYYRLFPKYKQFRTTRLNPEVIGLGVIINIPEEHLSRARWRQDVQRLKNTYFKGGAR